jgi:predicted 3-demethylubiquinone-9 3-methyltransferase (glyoxalase superfamily)
VNFELEDQEFIGFNAGPEFKFNESISFFVECEDQADVDNFWEALTADGGEESMCGWLKDKYGLSWQIVPKRLGELMGDPDPEKSKRVRQAMLKMQKIIVADLQKAYEG